MGKYEALGTFLRKQGREQVRLTFTEVEKIVGSPLPPSKRYPAWWSNNPSNNVMTRIWMEAGYRTEQVDIEGETLVFRRVGPPVSPSGGAVGRGAGPLPDDLVHSRHPAYGCMKGMVTIAPGTDLTAPADPEWADIAEKSDLPRAARTPERT
jgi:hypothetical protein